MQRAQRWLPAAFAVTLALMVYLETRLWLVAKFPYFLDEGILAQFAQYGRRDADERLISLQAGIRPGLVWLTIGGMKLQLAPLVSIRVVAVLFGLLALVSGTILALRYVGKTAAIAFVVLALFTPFLFLYNSLGLRDPVIAGLVAAGFLLELELARRPHFAFGVLLGLTFALTIWTKESGKVAIYLLPLSLVYFPFRSPQRVRLAFAWAGNVAGALVLAYAATWPLSLTSSYARLPETQHALALTRSFSSIRAHPLRYFHDSWPAIHGELTAYLTWPVVVVAFAGLVLGLRRRTRFTALVAVWAIAQIAAAVWLARNTYARYLVPAVPFVLLLAAIGVDELRRLAVAVLGGGRRVVLVGAAAGLLLLVPALVFDAQASFAPASAPYPRSDKVQYVTGYTAGFGVRKAVDELQLVAGGGRLVALTDPISANIPLEVLADERGLDIEWVWLGNADARLAQVLVVNNTSFPAVPWRFHKIWGYERPHQGVPLEIYVRG
jgi:hypothetical protein